MGTGAFGSGAGFAMQDGWLLAQILGDELSRSSNRPDAIAHSLDRFNAIRSPYYTKMYDYLDSGKDAYGTGTTLSADPAGKLYWIYGLDIGQQWEEIREQDERERATDGVVGAV